MKVLVIGGTGFIGAHLVERLLEREHEVTIFTRNEKKARTRFGNRVHAIQWKTDEFVLLQEYAHKVHAVINLAGENIAGKKWTAYQKRKILSSRVNIGKSLSHAIQKSQDKPYLLLQASAIGFYGFSESEEFTEDAPAGEGFLPMVTKHWEDTIRKVKGDKTRKVFLRTGIILGEKGGMLPKMMLPFRWWIGGHIGSGKQWLSWIHIDDEVNAIIYLLEKKDSEGAYNLTAPNPVRMKTFAKTLGETMGKPSWFPVPGFILKAIYGDMAKETMLKGQKVLPKRLLDEGFQFKFTKLDNALEDLLNKKG